MSERKPIPYIAPKLTPGESLSKTGRRRVTDLLSDIFDPVNKQFFDSTFEQLLFMVI